MVLLASPSSHNQVGVRLRPLGNAACVACLLLLCQGSKWLNGKSVWLVFRRSWVGVSAGSQIFFPWSCSLSAKNIHECLLKPLNLCMFGNCLQNCIHPIHFKRWMACRVYCQLKIPLIPIAVCMKMRMLSCCCQLHKSVCYEVLTFACWASWARVG